MANQADTETPAAEEIGLIPEIEEAIAQDEEAERQSSSERPRRDNGQFARATETDAQEGDDGERAPGEAEGEESVSEEKPPAKPGQQQQNGEQKPADKPESQDQSSNEQNQTKPKSDWAKNRERQDRSWKALNADKDAWTKQRDAEREQLRIEREQFDAMQKASPVRPPTDAQGRTSADYRKAATEWANEATAAEAQASRADIAGNFDRADQLTAEANRLKKLARDAEAVAQRLEPTRLTDVWAKLGQDAPIAIDRSNPLNKRLLETLKGDQALMADPVGPYRAFIRIGAAEVKRLETELAQSKTEAAKLPALLKQIETLTAKVQELTQQTTLSDGDEANLSRGGAGEQNPDNIPLDELERWVERDVASRV